MKQPCQIAPTLAEILIQEDRMAREAKAALAEQEREADERLEVHIRTFFKTSSEPVLFRESLVSEQETIAQLADHMSDDIRHLPPDQARKRAYAYGSLAHDELLRQGFHDDRATAVIEAALEIVFERLGLGKPD